MIIKGGNLSEFAVKFAIVTLCLFVQTLHILSPHPSM